jgi:hypothetical protein
LPRWGTECTENLLATAPTVGYEEKYFYNYYDFHPKTHTLEFNKTVLEDHPLYSGYPTPEMDVAWDELLKGSYMELTEEEIQLVGKEAFWELEKINGHVYMEYVLSFCRAR